MKLVKTPHAFRLAKLALLWIIATSAVAMLVYPGGTYLDPSTQGYSFFRNSLSDLGATVALNGQSNLVSAIVFDIGFATMLLGLLPAFAVLIRLYWELPKQKLLTVLLVCTVVFSCACVVGIGLSPHNEFAAVHHALNVLAFLTFPIPLLVLALLNLRDPRFSRRAVLGWLTLAVIVAGYDITLTMPSHLWPSFNLAFHVTSQKVVAIAAVLAILLQISEAERTMRHSYVSV